MPIQAIIFSFFDFFEIFYENFYFFPHWMPFQTPSWRETMVVAPALETDDRRFESPPLGENEDD
jgi:hypothetical protein